MLQKAISNYYTFFDETLESTTFIVLIITMLIFIVGTFVPQANANSRLKANLLEQNISHSFQNIVVIDGVEYEVRFSKTN